MNPFDAFGQKVDLTQRIRDILQNYPEGTSVLKEIIQNADDAGATLIKFALDLRQHPTGKLACEGLAEFSGEALLAYNNAVFSQADLDSISHVGASVKRNQVGKTGRFGIGFNSAYHLTDVPSFVTNSNLVIFDPHTDILGVSASNPGLKANFVESNFRSWFPDQCKPYEAFGCDMEHSFAGTLFRYPLRDALRAQSSRLSKQVYTRDKVEDLFESLKKEAESMLLFLKTVEKIEIYSWPPDANEPVLKFRCCILDLTDAVRTARCMFATKMQPQDAAKMEIFQLDIQKEAFAEQQRDKAAKSICRFLVGLSLASREAAVHAQQAAQAFGVPVTPFAGLAAPLHGSQAGQAFCFLPLPVYTALPCHVNGFFELSSNRRDLWLGDDLQGVGKMRAEWNLHLLRLVVAPLYAAVLARAAALLGPCQRYWELWPAHQELQEPWAMLSMETYGAMQDQAVLYTRAAGGWLLPSDAVLAAASEREAPLMAAVEAIGLPLAQLPRHLLADAMQFMNPMPQLLTPSRVQEFIKERADRVKQVCSQNPAFAASLLAYCMADIDDDSPQDLMGLPLVPMMDGSLHTFGPLRGEEAAACIPTRLERSLFQTSCSFTLVNTECCDPDIITRLCHMADKQQLDVCRISCRTLIEKLLPKVLPAACQGKREVPWTPGKNGMPNTAWMQSFWAYLNQVWYDLNVFVGSWPILPVTSGSLVQLQRIKYSTAVFQSQEWRSDFQGLLLQLGLRIVDASSYQHRRLSRHVHSSDCNGVLHALAAQRTSEEHTDFSQLSPQQCRQLRDFVLQVEGFQEAGVKVLVDTAKSLPIFEVADPSKQGSCLTSFRQGLHLVPLDVPRDVLPNSCVLCWDDRQRAVMVNQLGIPLCSLTDFFREMMGRLGSLEEAARDAAVAHMLDHALQLDDDFKQELKTIPFLPNQLGQLHTPGSLYDPSNPDMWELLDHQSHFPRNQFGSSMSLRYQLKRLGLQTELTADTLLIMALQIQTHSDSDPQASHARGQKLLEIIGREGMRLWRVHSSLNRGTAPAEEAEFWRQLSEIKWCPVLQQAPSPGMPWPQTLPSVAMPHSMRPLEDAWKVSTSMSIIHGVVSTIMKEAMVWTQGPPAQVIALQLAEIGRLNSHDLSSYQSQVLAVQIPQLYQAMEAADEQTLDVVQQILAEAKWVWTGAGFVGSKQVALEGPLQLSPNLYVVPSELTPFKQLLLRMGVARQFSAEQYKTLLSDMAHAAHGRALSSSEVNKALIVVQALSEMTVGDNDVIWIPDTENVMRVAKDLTFDDAAWLEPDGVNYVHNTLSKQVCARVGVYALRERLLEESSDLMEISEEYGQSEAITTRLKHITDAYSDGPGIFMELIQNADDAGASEVALMLDMHAYPTSSILGEGLADWQGPAIYAWNNAVFSPTDFKSISQIGQDKKVESMRSIGRFGLGFNSVYHFTDVPSFVSGDHLVVFDPHGSYLPNKRKGLRIAFQKMKLRQKFPDATAPYMHFGCNMQDRFHGTLFRFPLRTTDLARQSDIRKNAYTPEHVMALFQAFNHQASKALIFLKNVGSVKIFQRPDSPAAEPELLFQTSLQTEGDTRPQQAILDYLAASGTSKHDLQQKLKKTDDKGLPLSSMPVTIQTRSHDIGTIDEHWLQLNCIGGGEAKAMACKAHSSGRSRWVPWVGVAIKFAVTTGGDLQLVPGVEGQAFSFLPLPGKTGLPVHINANFELSSNRRDVWWGDDMRGDGAERAAWNRALLVDAAAPCYAQILELASRRMGSCPEYFSLWPLAVLAEPWHSFQTALFAALPARSVFCTKARPGQWLTLSEVFLPDEACKASPDLTSHLQKAGITIVSMPDQIVEAVQAKCPGAACVTPSIVRASERQLKDYVSQSSTADRNKICGVLLEYLLSDLKLTTDMDCEEVAGLPLLSCRDGGVSEIRASTEAADLRFLMAEAEAQVLNMRAQIIIAWPVESSLGTKLLQIATEHDNLNIRRLTPLTLAKHFLPDILPSSWPEQQEVAWTPGHAGQPKRAWMKDLLRMLAGLSDLKALQEWPLLPIKPSSLRSINSSSQVIRQGSWPPGVQTALIKLGFAIVDEDCLPPLLGKLADCVHPPNAAGVLQALYDGNDRDIGKINALVVECKLDPIDRRQLCAFLIQARWFEEGLSSTQKGVLRALCIYETLPIEEESDCLDLMEARNIGPQGSDPLLLRGSKLIIPGSLYEAEVLEEYLGVSRLDESAFLVEYVLPRMDDVDSIARDKALADALDSEHISAELQTRLTTTAFIPVNGRGLCKADQMFDPRIPSLVKLVDDDAFPADPFSTSKVLDRLVGLGMKASVDAKVLLAAAKSLDGRTLDGQPAKSVPKASNAKLADRSATILLELNRLVNTGQLQPAFWANLSTLRWCTARCSSRLLGLEADVKVDDRFYEPTVLSSQASDASIFGVSLLLVGSPEQAVKQQLGWDKPAGPAVLGKQLDWLRDKAKDKLNNDPKSASVREVYGILEQHLGSDSQSRKLVEGLATRPRVWTGKKFLQPGSVLQVEHDFKPALDTLPSSYASAYPELWRAWKVGPSMTAAHLSRGLQNISSWAKGGPIPDHHLQLCVKLARALAPHGVTPGVCLPDVHNVMQPVGDLYHIEARTANWLAAEEQPDTAQLISPAIVEEIAEALGVQSLRQVVQESSGVTQVALACPGADKVMQSWSELQMEPHEYLEALVCSMAEMADSAHAECFELCLDTRQFARTSLLHPKLADFQEPALCCHIPGLKMSPEDLQNLQLVTAPYFFQGRECGYGSGFSLAYSCGDLLQVYSGGSLCVFDPSCCVFSATEASTGQGRCYTVAGTNLQKRFPDQFAGWDFAGPMNFDLENKSTLIRIPLTRKSASIFSEVPADRTQEVRSKLTTISKRASNFMLFASSIQKLVIAHTAPGPVTQTIAKISILPTEGDLLRLPWPRRDLNRNSPHTSGMLTDARFEFSISISTDGGNGGMHEEEESWILHMSTCSVQSAANRSGSKGIGACAFRYKDEDGADRPTLVPVNGGMYAPYPILGRELLHQSAKALPFLACGNFALKSQQLQLFDEAHQDPSNVAILQQAVTRAWFSAFTEASQSFRQPHFLLPSSSFGSYEPLSVELLKLAGRGQYWPMWIGGTLKLGSLREGVFAGPDYHSLGEDLQLLLKKSIPILEAPWDIKLALQQAGLTGLKELTPSTLRSYKAAITGLASQVQLEPEQSAAVLAYAMGDLKAAPCRSAQSTTTAESAAFDRLMQQERTIRLQIYKELQWMPILDASGSAQPIGTKKLHWWPASMPEMPPSLVLSMSQSLVHPEVSAALYSRLEVCDANEMGNHLKLVKLDASTLLSLMSLTCLKPLAFPGRPTISRDHAARLVRLDWQELWQYLHAIFSIPHEPEVWSLLDDCRVVPLADGSMHTMKKRDRIFVLPEGASADDDDHHGPAFEWATLLPMINRVELPILSPDFPMCRSWCQTSASQDTILLKLTMPGDPTIHVEMLEEGEIAAICAYFSKHVPNVVKDHGKDFLRAVPMFPTWDNTQIHAEGCLGVCAQDRAGSSCCKPEKLPALFKGQLLKLEGGLLRLAEKLAIPILKNRDLLLTIILPNLDSLAQAEQKTALEWIVNHWEEIKDDQELRRLLASTKFVTAGEDSQECFRPRDLYDPGNTLLARVFEHDNKLPSSEFSSPRWIKVLKDLGLQSSVDGDTFLKVATRIQSDWLRATLPTSLPARPGGASSPQRAQIWETAVQAAKYLRNHASHLHGNDFYSSLTLLQFMPATRGLPGTPGAEKVLTTFGSAAVEKDWMLAWTVRDILAEDCLPNKQAWTPLGLRSPPVMDVVVAHLKEIGADQGQHCLTAWPPSAGPVEDAFHSIFTYLDNQGGGSSIAGRLTEVAFIPVHHNSRLAAPRQTFFRLRRPLHPFAFELAPIYSQHAKLLLNLGCRDEPHPADFLQIYLEACERRPNMVMNINELQNVIALLNELSREPGMRTSLADLRQSGSLLLPNVFATLVPANLCLHTLSAPDNLTRRVDLEKVHVLHPLLSINLCQLLGVPALEACVQEVVDPSHPMKQIPEIQGRSRSELSHLLASSETSRAVHSVLAQHQRFLPSFQSLSSDRVASRLRDVGHRLKLVDEIRTRLVLTSQAINVTHNGSTPDTFFFEDRASDAICIAAPPAGISLECVLSMAISNACGSPLRLPLDTILTCPITAASRLWGSVLPHTSGKGLIEVASAAGQPGKLLTAEDEACLAPVPLRLFPADEICAARLTDLCGAQQPHDLPQTGADIVYVRVIQDAGPSAGQMMFPVRVEAGPGQDCTLLSCKLFTFMSRQHGRSTAEAAPPSTPVPLTPNPSRRASSSMADSTTTPGPSGSRTPMMGPTEMASAVRDMLLAANLPVKLETSQLLQRTLALQEELDAKNSSLITAEKEAAAAASSMEAHQTKWLCKICSDVDVDTVMSPCGHMLCADCCSEVKQMAQHHRKPFECPFCKSGVQLACKLYNT